jgi:hypothetical protein
MHAQDHPAEHVRPFQAPVRLRRLAERIGRGDRDADAGVRQVTIQLAERAWIGDGVVGTDAEQAPLARWRLDAVWMHDASSRPHEIEATLELVPARKRQHAVQAIRCVLPQCVDGRLAPRIDDASAPSRRTRRVAAAPEAVAITCAPRAN